MIPNPRLSFRHWSALVDAGQRGFEALHAIRASRRAISLLNLRLMADAVITGPQRHAYQHWRGLHAHLPPDRSGAILRSEEQGFERIMKTIKLPGAAFDILPLVWRLRTRRGWLTLAKPRFWLRQWPPIHWGAW